MWYERCYLNHSLFEGSVVVCNDSREVKTVALLHVEPKAVGPFGIDNNLNGSFPCIEGDRTLPIHSRKHVGLELQLAGQHRELLRYSECICAERHANAMTPALWQLSKRAELPSERITARVRVPRKQILSGSDANEHLAFLPPLPHR